MTVIVIGGGPAGVRAVQCLLAHGLRPAWIDEALRPGGQIYRRPPPALQRPARALYGFEAGKARRLHEAGDAAAKAADYRPETLAWDITEGAVHVLGPRGSEALAYDGLILATGAMDRIIPIPGWTLPGVFTLGGAQVALKAQACAIGRRSILLGTGPLLYLVAYQYAKAGAVLAGVLDTSPAEARFRALRGLLAAPATLAKGLHYTVWLRARGIAHWDGIEPLAILGATEVTGLSFHDRTGAVRDIEGDAVALGFGLKPETQLAELAGCRFGFDEASRQWLPSTDGEGRASGVPGLYLAGDGAGIAGADAAELAGERAALALLADRGIAVSAARRRQITRRLARIARFRRALETAFAYLSGLAPRLPDEAILCRCEGVSVGELRATAAIGAQEMNRAKAFCRVGMGRCQGRLCGGPAVEILAAARGVDLPAVGRLRGQPPVKPVPVEALVAGVP
jgi:NADPH-dependent 2,4-dienoyl-CoA reductase/sulfur reductase-like enzyme